MILAKIFGYSKMTYLEVPEEKKADIKIDFS